MLKDSLYAKHLEERGGGKLLETEHSFVAYRVIKTESFAELFIINIYVSPECRQAGEARGIVSKLSEIAKENECSVITGSVQLDDPGASNTLIAALMMGFRVVNANAASLFIAKEVGGSHG
jgi:predicted GNAT superfamily acetyltransferase